MEKKHPIFDMPFSRIYLLYIQKVEKKGKSKAEVDTLIKWLTGYSDLELEAQITNHVTMESFFEGAPMFNENAPLIKGLICGHRIEEIEDDRMRKIRYLDKLIDELAKGKAMAKIMRTP